MPRRHRAGATQASLVARIEEVILASSGADAFELVFALVAAQIWNEREAAHSASRSRRAASVGKAAKRWPFLELGADLAIEPPILDEVERLLDGLTLGAPEALDPLFEQLVTRVGKGVKGQFFTPRVVADFAARSLALADGERVVDPACGSGALLAHARRQAQVETWGVDIDARAVRVARLLALATRADPTRIDRGDSLREAAAFPPEVDVVLTNPPFAGRAESAGYEVASVGGPVERDALFLERSVQLLRRGGRLAIVLPHNKVAGASFAGLRRWLLARARVFAVVSLPHAAFMPHTSQKTVVLFAKKRTREGAAANERIFFASADSDVAGSLSAKLALISKPLASFLAGEGFVG